MRKEKLGFVNCVWFLLMCGSCLGRFVVKNSLKVTSPENLKDTYECAIDDFGVPQYGGTLTGVVVYPKANQKACKSFISYVSFKIRSPGALPIFVLADRGDCYFTLKAWNAQNAGAAAILVADDRHEPLITMDLAEAAWGGDYLQNITIPSAFISKSLGDAIKKTINKGELVQINLDWREVLPQPDEQVKYKFSTNNNDECDPKCDRQIDFVKSSNGAAQVLEQKGYTQSAPYYITWYCAEVFISSTQRKSYCIKHGRYSASDPEQDFIKGHVGEDLVARNLRSAYLCRFGDCYFTLKAWNAHDAEAAAILVADNRPESMITMDSPQEKNEGGDAIKKAIVVERQKAINKLDLVHMDLDWREARLHPDVRVEYEFWTNSNDEFGSDGQTEFVKSFKGAAKILEQKGYTQFTPHYMTWYCPEPHILSKQCRSQCINRGRYCAPDPEHDFSRGYDGKDVVVQNLRQACFYKVANETGKPWLWWDYVTDFAIRCPMKEKKYTKGCADEVIKSLGADLKKIDECIGDPEADVKNAVLEAEQEAQIGRGSREDVTILPTLIINNRQYRGKLEKAAVLKVICSGFEETSQPALCLSDETNECLDNNGGCWMDKVANIIACRDTFQGRVCECPIVPSVKFVGDGYTRCEGHYSWVCCCRSCRICFLQVQNPEIRGFRDSGYDDTVHVVGQSGKRCHPRGSRKRLGKDCNNKKRHNKTRNSRFKLPNQHLLC